MSVVPYFARVPFPLVSSEEDEKFEKSWMTAVPALSGFLPTSPCGLAWTWLTAELKFSHNGWHRTEGDRDLYQVAVPKNEMGTIMQIFFFSR